jgi:hypothetical protein
LENEDGAFHGHSWTQQHWINAAQSARLLGRRWSARAFVAIILAIVAIALVIWFALGG